MFTNAQYFFFTDLIQNEILNNLNIFNKKWKKNHSLGSIYICRKKIREM